MRKLCALLVLAAAAALAQQEDAFLRVRTLDGVVRGYLGRSCRNGTPFAGFRGIPYAEPPLGSLRFKDPLPKAGWSEVWDATVQRCSCIQGDAEGAEGGFPADGGFSEDCLYLNVYTPNLEYLTNRPGARLKAVMVFIHPGAFNQGGSSESVSSPDFLVDQDVVLVTFNYRLGALGFLSLQNADVPGNAGLKDQNLALRWVRNNIRAFGGDPNRVTIFGESAGAASVHYHMLSPSSKGLFRAAIMQSGSAITPWAYSAPDLALSKAHKLGKMFGCSQDPPALLECLQRVSPEAITDAQQKALTLQELLSLRIIAFHPTTEPPVPGAFITDHPFELMYAGNFTKVPAIIGSTSNEGLLVYPALMKNDPHGYLLTLLGMDLSRFAPYNFHVRPLTKAAIHTHREISRFYFNRRFVSNALMGNMLELLSDVMFVLPIQLTASLLSNASVPVYNYEFSYDGGYNVGKLVGGIMSVPGVSHGDDLGYLFYTPEIHRNCGNVSAGHLQDELTIDRMTTMWAAFAKTGTPTPRNQREVVWKPFTEERRPYLYIGENLVPSEGLKLANMIFWEELIKTLMDLRGSARELIDYLDPVEATTA